MARMTPEAEALLAAVRLGTGERIPGLLKPMDDTARRACLASVKKLDKELGTGVVPGQVVRAVHVAGVGCQSGAAAAAQSIARAFTGSELWRDELLEVLAERDPAWLGDLTRQLMDRAPRNWKLHPVITALVRMADREPTPRDVYVLKWLDEMPYGSLPATGRVDDDPLTPVLLRQLFEIEGAGLLVERHDVWKEYLATSGVFDRRTLIDRCVARLLRGSSRAVELRAFTNLLDSVEPTEDELAQHAGDWMRLAADGSAPVAGRAQAVLRRLWEAGRLNASAVAQVSRDVLFRPEQKLAGAQLALLGRALRQAPGDAGQLLTAVAVAFGHQDNGVQERAWKLAARYAGTADAAVRVELTEAAALLTPGLRAQAATVLGEPADDAATATATATLSAAPSPYEETLPAVSTPQRAAPAPDSLEEVVGEIAAVLKRRQRSVLQLERLLDGMVRQAHHNRTAFVQALTTLAERHSSLAEERHYTQGQQGIGVVAAVLLGTVDAREVPAGPPDAPDKCWHCVFENTWQARLLEAARRVGTDPLLLATPTWHTGALDAQELLDRLTEYGRLGMEPGPADFDQALLRIRMPYAPDRDRLGAAARRLDTAEGTRLADWLDAGGLEAGPDLSFDWDGSVAQDGIPAIRRDFTEPFAVLGRPRMPDSYNTHYHQVTDVPRWIATVPGHREYIAVKVLSRMHPGDDAPTRHLPLLVEAGGPCGLSVQQTVACGLACPVARTSAVDALLQLAARDELDAERCGDELGELADEPAWLQAYADALTTAARTGAYATVWAILASALPGLLKESARHRRLGTLLSIAAECVERCGATGTIPGLEEVAGRGGSSKLVTQARRLRACLGAAGADPA